jgi:hypothetical protein
MSERSHFWIADPKKKERGATDSCRLHTTDSSRLFKLHQMTSLVTLSAPLNQGSFGSCAGYAFAKALADGVLGKYAVPLDVMEVLGAVKLLCPCWEGSRIETMCEQWNNKVGKRTSSWFADIDSECRYQVKVHSERLNTFEEAYAYMKEVSGVLFLLVAIKTDTDGHTNHAVVADKTYQGSAMRGMNSWGANQVFMDITPDNFLRACVVEPILLAKKRGNQTVPIPVLTRGYNEIGIARENELEMRTKIKILKYQQRENELEIKGQKLDRNCSLSEIKILKNQLNSVLSNCGHYQRELRKVSRKRKRKRSVPEAAYEQQITTANNQSTVAEWLAALCLSGTGAEWWLDKEGFDD